jgi:hypothetical protein
MNQHTYAGLVDELEKISATRMEREVRKGSIRRSQVVPGAIDAPQGPLGAVGRKYARNQLAAQAPVAPEALERGRRMNQLVYENRMRNPGSMPGVGGMGARMVPGMGPGMMAGDVFVPPTSGQFMRATAGGPISQTRAALMSYSDMSEAPALQRIGQMVTPARQPMDASITNSVLSHEGGEAAEYRKVLQGKAINPNASHLGLKPHFDERMPLRNDPEAYKAAVGGARSVHPDDKLVGKLMTQAGARPNAPLPSGGRAERTVERMLARNTDKLSPATRAKAVAMSAQGVNVGYLPEEVAMAPKAVGAAGLGLKKAWSKRNLGEGLQHAKGFVKGLGRMAKFVSKGR